MNPNRVLLGAAALLITTSAFADLKSDWQKKMDNFCAAQKRKDVKTCVTIIKNEFAPEFKFIPLKGKSINLSEWIAQSKMEIEMSGKVKHFTITINKVTMGKGGTTATMTTTVSYQGTVKMDPKAKEQVMKVLSDAEQKMVKKGDKWWILEIKQKNEKATLDGKPMPG